MSKNLHTHKLVSVEALKAVTECKPRLIASDMDGTFLASGLRIPPSALLAYRHAQTAGFLVIPATGRSPEGVKDALIATNTKAVNLTPGVYLNGGLTYGVDGEVLLNEYVCYDLLTRLYEFVAETNKKVMANANWQEDELIKHAPKEHGFFPVKDHSLPPAYLSVGGYTEEAVVVDRYDQLVDGFSQLKDGPIQVVGDMLQYCKHNPLHKIIILTYGELIVEKISPEIERLVGDTGVIAGGLRRMMEISPPGKAQRRFRKTRFLGVNKTVGLELVAKQLGYTIKDMVALGDGSNDLEMLRYGGGATLFLLNRKCGMSIAMGNADEHIKDAADFVTHDVDNDGWSYAVNSILAAHSDFPVDYV